MSHNNTSVGEKLGLGCPQGGTLYICAGTWSEFAGCCESDPCALEAGCPLSDLRPTTFNKYAFEDMRNEQCIGEDPDVHQWTCVEPPFFGCCSINPCIQNGCPSENLRSLSLKYDSPLRPMKSTDTGYISTFQESNQKWVTHGTWGALKTNEVVGITIGFLLLSFITLGFIWSQSPWRKDNRPSRSSLSAGTENAMSTKTTQAYAPLAANDSVNICQELCRDQHVSGESLFGPQKLHSVAASWYLELGWDILLTLAPMFFIIIATLNLAIDDMRVSASGQKILEINRLIPTIYPIIFAAISSRFFKNTARWRLEHREGIQIGILEQIFGSQSLAGCIERLLFVRAQVPVGIAILVLWSFSPLGGQSGSRILYRGQSSTETSGNVYYFHPSYQFSRYKIKSWTQSLENDINLLYSSNMISSPEQKQSAQDIWDLPRIPQWRKRRVPDEYELDSNDVEYISLLGIQIRGLNQVSDIVEYDFSVETPYLDFDCVLKGHNILSDIPPHGLKNTSTGSFDFGGNSFSLNLTNENSLLNWEKGRGPPQMIYISTHGRAKYTSFECNTNVVVLETTMKCIPGSKTQNCSAISQKRLDSANAGDVLLEQILGSQIERPYFFKSLIDRWVDSAGKSKSASPTDRYISGDDRPYSGKSYVNWTEKSITNGIDPGMVSRRLTTSFNTYWWATLDPTGHTNVAYSALPNSTQIPPPGVDSNAEVFLNSTMAKATLKNGVYLVDRYWAAAFFTATFILQLLAAFGLALRFFVQGPDILGFASSLTRNNSYTPQATGGTSLDGPERARLLRNMRVHLVDVKPEEEIGHITVREVPEPAQLPAEEENDGTESENPHRSWQPMHKGRLYL